MKTSARNQFTGTVTEVKKGAVNDEIVITLPGGPRITAIVTGASTDRLGLKRGAPATALIKASSIIVATELDGARVSARNQLAGTVSTVTPGAVNGEVHIDLDGGGSMVAIITQASVSHLGLAKGQRVTALFKASSVILMA